MKQLTRYLSTLATILAIAATLGACKTTPTNPDSFYQAVVTCTVDNSSNTQAGAAVLKCLTGAVAGDYTACLAGLVTDGYWTVDEVACIVRRYATTSAQRLNAGTGDATDPVVLKNANEWLRKNDVRFKVAN